jgi:putative ABC transport system ATP-binding protein
MSPLIAVSNLHKSYRLGTENIQALRGVSLQVQRGEFVAIMGASGSGKTTLLHLIGGLDVPDSGKVEVAGEHINEMTDEARTLFRRRRLGIVFQSFNLMPTLTALENVMLPLLVDGKSAAAARERAVELITMVHLEHRLRHRPTALSGGEQQRVAIARSLVNEPDVILADEPTGNLDPTSSDEIRRLLRDLALETATTVLMVTHEPSAAAYADRVHVLKEGQFTGIIEPLGSGDAALVANRYAELAD